MGLLSWLKGVFNKMIGKESIQQVLKVTPIVSDKMRNAIELWENMYKGDSPWLNENIHSLGLPSLIASEKARMATIEMEIKVTGDNDRANFLRDSFHQVELSIRKELEYGLALGGFVIKPYIVKGPNDKYKVKFNYVTAANFYPLAFSADGKLTSGAFFDRIIKGDKVYTKFEIHTLEDNVVTVSNRAFVTEYKKDFTNRDDVLGSEISLASVPEWSAIEPMVTIDGIDTLLFAYFRNPEANTIDLDSPLGASGYSRAVGLIQKADEQYSNLLWEFEGGQLAVDVDRTALNPLRDANGKDKVVLPKLQDRLFRRNLDLGEDDMYNVYSPQLRDDSIINGLNNILMHIEDVCALSRGTISEVTMSEARTATELKILKQRAFSANADIQKELQKTFADIFNIIDIYCNLYHIVAAGEYEVAYHWDDSILVDKDAERQIDLIDVEKGLMSKVEYRMKWKGETRNQAEAAIKEIQDAALEAQRRTLEMGAQFAEKSEKSEDQTAYKRGVESNSPKKDEKSEK